VSGGERGVLEHYSNFEGGRRTRPPGLDITCPEVPLPVHARDEVRAHPQAWSDAVRLFREGDYAAAAMAFGLIARLGPESRRARIAQASALINLGQFARAARLLQRAVQGDPADPIAAMNLATAQFCAGRLEEAIGQARVSVGLFRAAGLDVARPRHLEGLIYLEMGRLERAARSLAQGLLAHVPEDIREVTVEAVERFARHLADHPTRWVSRWRRRLSQFRRRQQCHDAAAPESGMDKDDED